MKGLFSFDGPLYKFCVLIYETFMLNLLWVIGSIPIITMGVSTSALYYVYGKKIRGNSYSIYGDFIKGYKESFKQALPLGAVITLILSFSIFNLFILNKIGTRYSLIQILQIFIMLQILLISVFLFPLVARFKVGFHELLRNSVVLAYKHILVSASSAGMLILLIGLAVFRPSFGLFFIAVYVHISSYFIEKVFNNYVKCEAD